MSSRVSNARRLLHALAATSLGAITVQSASAAVIDRGFSLEDTATQLEWYDLSGTRGMSYNAIKAQLGAGGLFEGYRFATQQEVVDLMAHYGIIPQTTLTAAIVDIPALGYEPAFAFQLAMGLTRYIEGEGLSYYGYTTGYTYFDGQPGGLLDTLSLQVYRSWTTDTQNAAVRLSNDWLPTADATLSDTGSWLVRPVSTVPEPRTYALILGGLAAIGFAVRRRSERD